MTQTQTKRIKSATALAFGLGALLALSSVSIAQTTNPASGADAGGGVRHAAISPAQMIKQSLDLTDEQATKLEPALRAHQDQLAALRRDTTLCRHERAAKFKEIQAATDAKMKDHLTPEQAAKWQQMRTPSSAFSRSNISPQALAFRFSSRTNQPFAAGSPAAWQNFQRPGSRIQDPFPAASIHQSTNPPIPEPSR